MTLEAKAKALRAKGKTYMEIAKALGISQPKAWIYCNRERHRKTTNESCARYYARGNKALCDV